MLHCFFRAHPAPAATDSRHAAATSYRLQESRLNSHCTSTNITIASAQWSTSRSQLGIKAVVERALARKLPQTSFHFRRWIWRIKVVYKVWVSCFGKILTKCAGKSLPDVLLRPFWQDKLYFLMQGNKARRGETIRNSTRARALTSSKQVWAKVFADLRKRSSFDPTTHLHVDEPWFKDI